MFAEKAHYIDSHFNKIAKLIINIIPTLRRTDVRQNSSLSTLRRACRRPAGAASLDVAGAGGPPCN